jgi:hypothetical protein
VTGDFGELYHFNGATWHNFTAQTGLEDGYYRRIAMKGDIIVAVGENSGRAAIALGRR